MLTVPDTSLRQRLINELLTEEGELDWERLHQIAGLAMSDQGFHLDAEGLAGPALDMLLSPEGAALRRAVVSELLRAPQNGDHPMASLVGLLAADGSMSAQQILDRLVSFVFSPEGAETRAQLTAGLKSNGSFDLVRALELSASAGRLNPGFSAGTVLRSVGGYLLSEQGKPMRNDLLRAGAERAVEGLLRVVMRPQPASPALSRQKLALTEGD
jgi:hypothetical protein